MSKGKNKHLSTTQIILLGFLIIIFLGSGLLALPISAADGKPLPYIDALFTATTATCVTGLVTVTTATAWSPFGQAVILVLIQIGGLGFITVMTAVMIAMNRRIGIGDRLLIQDAFNLNTMSGLVAFVRRVLLGTLTVEGIGAVLYMLVFVPEFGVRGIWISLFNSVSAFCNAGMDIIGPSSLCDYALDPLINLTTSGLIILGGIGYVVWWDVIRVIRTRTKKNRKIFRHLTLHSKIALTSTAVLLLGGTVLFFLFEYHNPLTLGPLSLLDKLQVAAFQSVTTRTAGFATVPQEHLTNASSLVSLLLMFIGGSPVGTAGGVKTVTVAVLVCSAFSSIINREETSLFGRAIALRSITKAVAVLMASFAIMFLSTVILAAVMDAPLIDILYETVSATATVGLSRNLTGSLNLAGKLTVIVTMYFGRVGPISLAIALGSRKTSGNIVKNPVEDISIG